MRYLTGGKHWKFWVAGSKGECWEGGGRYWVSVLQPSTCSVPNTGGRCNFLSVLSSAYVEVLGADEIRACMDCSVSPIPLLPPASVVELIQECFVVKETNEK